MQLWCILQLYCYMTASVAATDHTERPDTGDVATANTTSGSPVTHTGSLAALHFWLTWLAIGNSFWKFVVYVICFHDFRTGLRILYSNYVACR